MTKSVYVLSPEGLVGKSAIALGMIDALGRHVSSIGVFRPIIRTDGRDVILESLVELPNIRQTYDEAYGVPYSAVQANPDQAMSEIIHRYETIKENYDAVVVVGSDYVGDLGASEFGYNVSVAANLNTPVLLVVRGSDRSPQRLRLKVDSALEEVVQAHATPLGVIATRLEAEALESYQEALASLNHPIVAAMPDNQTLTAPTVRQQFAAAEATILHGSDEQLDAESLGVTIAGMTLPNVLNGLNPGYTVITAADRVDLLPGILMAHQAAGFPALAGLLLVGGFEIAPQIRTLLDTVGPKPPIAQTRFGTYTTAERMFGLEGEITDSSGKVEIARQMFERYVGAEKVGRALALVGSNVRTPLMFEYQVMQQARRDKRTIVLPEASDERILRSAHILLARNVADIVLLGQPPAIAAKAAELDLNLSRATIVDPTDPALLDKFAQEYARLRAKKGVSLEQAKEKMADLSYFGTMMVHFGLADGMVSGAVNTTANTIRPSLEFVKTKPGFSVVSSSFFMCLPDRVVVFADCAVNPNPTAAELADIAIASAETATAFGITPRVAMLSYSTGTSGSGEDVERVRQATELVRQRAPELKVEGPIQFDAAMDAEVARTKLPDSQVAGRATVFIFPDLNTGNNTYKAVQRTAGALAVGPVLQGLNKPVNDLSRGALVDDIVNTVAITAIQAQAEPAGQPSRFAPPQ
ncbi:MAG: phosphate acetyltransferase [Propionibacteriaceae bacterium]|jgi:phosphate acetyltransferase|nr:phosphate acetyltransferase [Propionibacteriaceae bacterium]